MKKTNSKWIAFFSQTGSEIVNIAKHTGIWPDLIVTNERPNSLRKIHPDIKDSSRLVTIPNKPTLEDVTTNQPSWNKAGHEKLGIKSWAF